MKNQFNALKLTFLVAAVGLLGVGCASSGYARYDGSPDAAAMGHAASGETGHSHGVDAGYYANFADTTVSGLGRTVDTRAEWLNRFPFYDMNLRSMEIYSLTAPNPHFDIAPSPSAWNDTSNQSTIQHTPNPSR